MLTYGRWQNIDQCQCGFISYIWDGSALHHSVHHVIGAHLNNGVCIKCGEKNKWTKKTGRRVFKTTLLLFDRFKKWEFKE